MLSILLGLAALLQAQEQEQNAKPKVAYGADKRNEIKLNAGMLLATTLEVSYERLSKDQRSSVGCSMGSTFNNAWHAAYNGAYFFPYYRLYFGRKKHATFFGEVNGAFFTSVLGGSSALGGAWLLAGNS